MRKFWKWLRDKGYLMWRRLGALGDTRQEWREVLREARVQKDYGSDPLEWVDWFNCRRLLVSIGYEPPAELKEMFYRAEVSAEGAGLK